jgi:group II intron reverse transcriptase/maturase
MGMHGGWILDVDIEDFFGSLDHKTLMGLLAKRIGDRRVLRLIGKWLKAGVMEGGVLERGQRGTPQGGVASPFLANVYLHYVLDGWFIEQVLPRLEGVAELIRYADDFVIACADGHDARRIFEVLPKRLGRFGLRLNEEKTRMVHFAQPSSRAKRGKPGASFSFLGFTHYWRRSRRGNWVVAQQTAKDRFAAAVQRLSQWCRFNRHRPVSEQHQHLCQMLRGHYAYYGVPGNGRALTRYRYLAFTVWMKWLERRSQRGQLPRSKRLAIADRWPLPMPRVGGYRMGHGHASFPSAGAGCAVAHVRI